MSSADLPAVMLAVASHDAGGAEVVSSYIRDRGISCLFVLDGPARVVFSRKLGTLLTVSLEEALARCDSMLCGTSWQSELEFSAIRRARELGKRSVAFLDHWVNYRERFVRGGETCLPDEIWVGDADAFTRAIDVFPGVPVVQVENPYVEGLRQELLQKAATRTGKPAADRRALLYVSEPVREHALRQFGNERHWGYVEEDALRYLLTNLDALGESTARITIRPHPSEPAGKYDWVLKEFDLPIVIGGQEPLLDEICAADVVMGCNSMAMVVGLIADKRVVSCIPPGGRPCVLPHLEIQSLQLLRAAVDAKANG